MKKKRNYIILILAILFLVFASILFINKRIKINPVFAAGYELRGVDVSHYQGTIKWDRLAEQNLDFAFIKATEGSSYLDECFYDNWQAAEETDLYIGAYHFFSFDSEGEKQAEFYIDTVGDLYGKLAPVIDVEFYGNKESNPPKKEEVVTQLGKMLTALEEHYQVKPVIYTTYKVYNSYIKGEFEEYPLWIRNVYYPPVDVLEGKWAFWQYMDTAVLEGYEGDEKYVDMNVFNGTKAELEELVVRCADEPESFCVYDDIEKKEEELEWDSWYKAYKAIINEWTLIEKFDDSGEIGYLKFYFDQSYGFDSYWLCDVDDNKVPELFLHSSSMNITAVLTYDKQPLIVLSTRIYGINEETGEIIEMGHWHGAGGSGTEHEFTGWQILGDYAEYSMYIDFYDFSENGDFIPLYGEESFYKIYDVETESYENTTDGAAYDEIYTTHVAPCTLVEDYQLYTLDDLSGLDKAWQENGGNNNILQTLNVDLEDAELIVTDCRYSAMQWGYTDIESFLKDFGFDNAKPFYQYYEEDSGELQLELYYDEKTGRRCGIRYYPGDGRNPEGFAFNGSDKHTYEYSYEVIKERVNADPYNILAKGEVDLSQDKDIKDFEEELEYTSDGRLKHYESQGWITYIGEEKEIQKLLEITLTYREDGTLKQRDYFHNTFALETWYSVVHSFYDKQERLLCEDCYITHGSMDYYYIYDGEEKVPSYCLIMDHNLNLLCVELLSIHDIIAN